MSSALAQGHLLGASASGPWLLSPGRKGPASGREPARRVLPQRREGTRCTGAQSRKQQRPRPPWSFQSAPILGSRQRPLRHTACAKRADNAGGWGGRRPDCDLHSIPDPSRGVRFGARRDEGRRAESRARPQAGPARCRHPPLHPGAARRPWRSPFS